MLHKLLLLTCAGIAMTTIGTSKAAEPEFVTTVEGISEYRLENGLKILLFPDPSKPQVTINMTVQVGSRHEGYGEAGMAHLLEHMLFKGTADHPEIPKVLKDHGAEFNGTTWLDRTNYYETLPASNENLEFALRLEADRMINSYIKAEDLASEMTVVRNEFERGENSPSRILAQKITSAAYEWHNYGQSTIGNRADIERVPVKNLREFYKKYYQPDNVMVIVAGAFDPDLALELIGKYFGAIPKPERVLEEPYTEEPAQDGERLVTLRRVGDVGLAGAIYHIPSGAHPDYVSLDVLDHILTDAPSGRLYKGLVESKLAASVSGGAYSLHDAGMTRVMAEASPGVDPRDVLAKMLEITESIGIEGVTEEEVERAKIYWNKTWEMSLSDSSKLAVQLSEWAAQGDWRLMFIYRDRLENVSVESVNSVATKYLKQNNRTAGLFIPTEKAERVTVPPTPDLAEMIGNYEGRESVAMGEAFDVSPANIEERTTRLKLASGIKAAFLPKKTRGESVVLRLTLRYGTADSLLGHATACEVLPALMTRGTSDLSRQQIKDILDKNKATFAPSGSPGEATFQIETRREHLSAVLDVVQQILREPSLPAEELELIRNKKIADYEQELSDPTALARIAISRTINESYPEEDVRYVRTIEEELTNWKKLKREEVLALYEEQLSGSHGELAIVGDFDPAEIQPIMEEMLGGWESDQEYARIPRSGKVDVKNTHETIQTPDKENATYLAGSVFEMKDTDSDYLGLMIGNYVLGSSGLASRLGDRVRQKEGLSYGVGSFLRPSAIDPRTTFLVYAITNPDNIKKVEVAVQEEIELLLAKGITPEELQSAQKGYVERQTVERSDDQQLAAILISTSHLDRTMDFYATQEKEIQSLTVEAVQQALTDRLSLKRLAVVVAGDFEKSKKEEKVTQKMDTPQKPADAGKEFITTKSGLKYRILTEGKGEKPAATATVVCHYKGWLDDGTEFDSSYKRGEPATFPLNRVIPGWTEGLQHVKQGGKIELEIPSDIGYGAGGAPPVIPPNATLHFEVELIEIK